MEENYIKAIERIYGDLNKVETIDQVEMISKLEELLEKSETKRDNLMDNITQLLVKHKEVKAKLRHYNKKYNITETHKDVHITEMNYLRRGMYLDILPLLYSIVNCGKDKFMMPNGNIINTGSTRYKVFLNKGIKCVNCGIEGKFLALEKDVKNTDSIFHLNLYALDKHGKEVMMTQDHIIPKSKGGSDDLDNLQPMCIICNRNKADSMEGDEQYENN